MPYLTFGDGSVKIQTQDVKEMKITNFHIIPYTSFDKELHLIGVAEKK